MSYVGRPIVLFTAVVGVLVFERGSVPYWRVIPGSYVTPSDY